MALVLSCDVPVNSPQDRLVQGRRVEPSRPFDGPRYAPIRAKRRDGLREAHKVTNAGIGSKADEYMNVINQDRASQNNSRGASSRTGYRDANVAGCISIHASDAVPRVPRDVCIQLVRAVTGHQPSRDSG
jgi:hypothetical protein